jgi:Protein of unknown function (DUF1203)
MMDFMTTITVRAIGPDVISELLDRDDAGNPARPFTATEGGSPLRCCLRPIRVGERVALVSYAPLRRWAAQTGAEPGPYDEVGPIFIHADGCEGPAGSGYPAPLAGGHRVLRAYSAAGTILGGTLLRPGPEADPAAAEAVLAGMFVDPEVALVHARALEFGCFTFEVRRGG